MDATEAGMGVPQTQQQPQNPVYVFVQPVTTTDAEHFKKTFPVRLVNALSAGQLFLFATGLVAEVGMHP